ncbi:hypothetical protein DEAC_c18790 [Desulfosporosinus acididurans]|uniref:Uncharacterized protein n=1 Tax=Desulfosporosinus acididurans TaxID=476652 RepID=A0A0J1FSM1_9FIRM|nr:hypothetical protein [Desulfosporosinus acididurans]KLU66480.1 hypothetical protein DEAC_c18790 [Desulfosporosinus acididurans]
MSRWKTIGLVLILGLGIGCLVPMATTWLSAKNLAVPKGYLEDGVALVSANAPETRAYHFSLNNNVLSVQEGKLGTEGKVIIKGLDVKTWPKAMLKMAPKVEFNSLDEVQSFIDTANEDLWKE